MICIRLARFARVLLAWALTLPGTLCTERTGYRPTMARCSFFGRDFVNTFDESMYSFAGDCSYLLAGDCQERSFSILRNFQNGNRVSLSVYLGEFFDIHLFVNGTAMQGAQRVSMPYASQGLYLETEAGYHKLSSEAYGFVARIDGGGSFEVLLSDRHSNRTCGLCGNFNIFAEDDFRTQEGETFWETVSLESTWAIRFLAHKHLPSPPLAFQPCRDFTAVSLASLFSQRSTLMSRLLSSQTLELLRPDFVQL